MTPQERALIEQLFDRLATLDSAPRDPEAERAIADGMARAPHGVYALVQSVLVQDEALKRADARIRDLEGTDEPPRPAGFLDSMRESLFGRADSRGSVPSVRPGGAWGNTQNPAAPPAYGAPTQNAAPMQSAPSGSFGGSFLGTAAASAAGVIGGALLLDGIRSMMSHGHGPFAGQSLADPSAGSPWTGNSAGSDLARDAGLGDIGNATSADAGTSRGLGLFDSADNTDLDTGDFDDGDGGFDLGGGDSDYA